MREPANQDEGFTAETLDLAKLLAAFPRGSGVTMRVRRSSDDDEQEVGNAAD